MLAKKRKQVQKIKSPKQIERHLKGVASHRRIEIIFLIAKNSGITLDGIAENLNCNIKTISGHTKSLQNAGLIRKNYFSQSVKHDLSPYGKAVYKFLIKFQKI